MDRYICNRCIHTYIYTVLHISGMQASVVFITLVGCYFQQLFRLCHNNFPTSPGHNVKNHLCYMSCMLLVLLLICKSLITKTENLYNQPLKISFLCKDIPSTTMWASIHFFFYKILVLFHKYSTWGLESLGKLASWQWFPRKSLVLWFWYKPLQIKEEISYGIKKGKKKKGIVSTSQATIFNSI